MESSQAIGKSLTCHLFCPRHAVWSPSPSIGGHSHGSLGLSGANAVCLYERSLLFRWNPHRELVICVPPSPLRTLLLEIKPLLSSRGEARQIPATNLLLKQTPRPNVRQMAYFFF